MDTALFQRLKTLRRLPTPPAVVVRLLEITRDPDVSIKAIADAIGHDPALSARILRYANSPIAGLSREVTSLHHAAALLGTRGVSTLALSFSVLSSTAAPQCSGFELQSFRMQSLACAVGARSIAVDSRVVAPDEAFMAGLLSQIGRSALARALPDQYAKVLRQCARVPDDLPPLEQAAFHATYATVGAHLLCDWGIPATLCDAIAQFRSLGDATGNGTTLARVLAVAETITSFVCPLPRDNRPPIEPCITALRRHFYLGPDQGRQLIQSVTARLDEARKALSMPQANMRPLDQIKADVKERLAELHVADQLETQAFLQQRAELIRRVSTDPLTGIANRAAFDERIEMELERAIRGAHPLTVLMIDIDRFKHLNDTHGHLAGDRVLRAVAQTLRDAVRRIDCVARYGGEEFSVIAPETNGHGAAAFAERLRARVENLAVEVDSKVLGVTISVGAAVLTKVTSDTTGGDIIRAADVQLYAAKRAGRNRVRVTVDGAALVPAGAAVG